MTWRKNSGEVFSGNLAKESLLFQQWGGGAGEKTLKEIWLFQVDCNSWRLNFSSDITSILHTCLGIVVLHLMVTQPYGLSFDFNHTRGVLIQMVRLWLRCLKQVMCRESGSVPAIFLLRITTTSNKCENLINLKLDLKVSEFRGRVIKRVLLSAVSPFPLIKPRVQPGRVYRVV
jgi:hypothetical protein